MQKKETQVQYKAYTPPKKKLGYTYTRKKKATIIQPRICKSHHKMFPKFLLILAKI